MMTFSLFVCNSLIHRRKTPQINFKLLIFPLSFALHLKDCKGSSDPPPWHTSLLLSLIHGDKDPCRNFLLSLLQLQLQLKYLHSHCLNYTHLHGITISTKNNQINPKSSLCQASEMSLYTMKHGHGKKGRVSVSDTFRTPTLLRHSCMRVHGVSGK